MHYWMNASRRGMNKPASARSVPNSPCLMLWLLVNNSQWTISGWWYTYPSEKYESQFHDYSQYYGNIKHVPNHQPAMYSWPKQITINQPSFRDCSYFMASTRIVTYNDIYNTTNCMDTMWVPIISFLDDLSVKIHWSMNIFPPGEMAMAYLAYLVNQWKITIQI